MPHAIKVAAAGGETPQPQQCVVVRNWGHSSNWQPQALRRVSLMHSVTIHPYKIFNGWHAGVGLETEVAWLTFLSGCRDVSP